MERDVTLMSHDIDLVPVSLLRCMCIEINSFHHVDYICGLEVVERQC